MLRSFLVYDSLCDRVTIRGVVDPSAAMLGAGSLGGEDWIARVQGPRMGYGHASKISAKETTKIWSY